MSRRKKDDTTLFHIRHYPFRRSWFVLRRGAYDVVQVGDGAKVLLMLRAELTGLVGI